jgi:muconate cycloisomerase
MSVDIGGSIELGIGNAANLHLGAALSNAILPSVCPVTKPKGCKGPEIAGIYYLDDIVKQAFDFVDGKVLRPQGVGLGVEVDDAKIKEYSL